MPDWSLFFSGITASAAVVALLFVGWQIKQSNKQKLFDKRLAIWTVAHGLMDLYVNVLPLFKWGESEQKPAFSNDFEFGIMTNNSYLYEITPAIKYPLDGDWQLVLLKKLEDMRRISLESNFVFEGNIASAVGEFVESYSEVLFSMYQYEILMSKIREANEKNPQIFDELAERYGEPTQRGELLNARKRLRDAYEKLTSEGEKKIERQCRLF